MVAKHRNMEVFELCNVLTEQIIRKTTKLNSQHLDFYLMYMTIVLDFKMFTLYVSK